MHSSDFDTITAYHQATKHHFHRYARSAGYMDWANQPNPFREFEGSAQFSLPVSNYPGDLPFDDLFSTPDDPPQPLTLTRLGAYLELSLGLSAWKAAGASKWALRINPSSGNLHPTEGHLLLPPLEELSGGVFHYDPLQHALQQRGRLSADQWHPLRDHFGGHGFLVALTSIFWREAWKYGERAYRYCCLDMGHALAALAFSARLHNWKAVGLVDVGDDQIASLLGFQHTAWHPLEEEWPEVLCWISVDPSQKNLYQNLPDKYESLFESMDFSGRPKPLSREPMEWPIIGQAARAAAKPPTAPAVSDIDESSDPVAPSPGGNQSAAGLIRQRRSGVSFNPHRSTIPLADFRSILDRTIPRSGVAPFGLGLMSAEVHLVLFVHRVADLAPGLYLLDRGRDRQKTLQAAWRSEFEWQQVWSDFPLWLLQQADMTYEAMEASCHQQIAGSSAFAVAMLARFEKVLHACPYRYRHLHWECGMIGQVIYLAAEASGMRGTGIGCFFDDAVHDMLGIEDMSHQCLYHFTVGYPIEDQRLATLPSYHHLDRS